MSPVEIAQGAAGIVQHAENLVGPRQQRATGFGQPDLTPQAIEQAHIELCFQGSEALAHGGLSQMQTLGGE